MDDGNKLNWWLTLLVVQSLSSSNLVPWHLRNKWRNCLHITRLLNFKSPTFIEKATLVLIKLVSHGLAISDIVGGILYLFLFDPTASIIGQGCLITGLPHLLSHMLGLFDTRPPTPHTHTHVFCIPLHYIFLICGYVANDC